MPSDRREFLSRIALSGLALQSFSADAAGLRNSIKAVAFDGFPILDPRPVFALVDQLYPENSVELSNLWRTRQFEYTWLRTMSRRSHRPTTKSADYSPNTKPRLVAIRAVANFVTRATFEAKN